MNILTESLPGSLKVGNKEYEIETDFRVWMRFVQDVFTAKDGYRTIAESMCRIFEEIPPNLIETLSAMMDFYTLCKKGDSGKTGPRNQQILDFDIDSGLIYAAFLQQYGIDLTKVDMHWWIFKTLIDNLSEDTQFVKIMQFRCKDISSIKDKEMKKFYQKMKRVYALPDNRSDEEKEQAFAEGLSGLF